MCIVRAAEMMQANWFLERKARIVFIGSGSPQVGKTVAVELGIFRQGARLLVDNSDDSRVYTSLGTKRGIGRTFTFTRLDNLVGLLKFPLEIARGRNPTVPLPIIGSRRKGESSAGDPFMQGATFIFDKNQQLFFRQIEESPGYPATDFRSLERVVLEGVKLGVVTVRPVDGKNDVRKWSHICIGLTVVLLTASCISNGTRATFPPVRMLV